MARPGKTPLNVYLDDEFYEMWRDKAKFDGVSVSAMLQTLAPDLGELMTLDRVTEARRLDTDRRGRGNS